MTYFSKKLFSCTLLILFCVSFYSSAAFAELDANTTGNTKTLAEETEKNKDTKVTTTPEPDVKAEKSKSWTDYIKPDLKAFLYYKLDASDGKNLQNEFGVGRAYFGAKVTPTKHFMFRITMDGKARLSTAKVSDDEQTVDVFDKNGEVMGSTTIPGQTTSTSKGAYSVYLKYAYLEAKDVGTKGLYFRLGQGGFIGVTELEKYWGYRYQGSMILDREKYGA